MGAWWLFKMRFFFNDRDFRANGVGHASLLQPSILPRASLLQPSLLLWEHASPFSSTASESCATTPETLSLSFSFSISGTACFWLKNRILACLQNEGSQVPVQIELITVG